MNSEFMTYLTLGFEHISDLQGYDHILFIISLCAVYKIQEWKKVALLVTAFTIGHSITLALASFDSIKMDSALIEFFIPLTILFNALLNTLKKNNALSYTTATIFGLIHGMGFSNFFKSAMLPGEASFLKPLFAFNLGVELGQLVIVGIILLFSFLALNILKIKQREWILFISGATAGLSLLMALERIPF
jgi:hypothetical protein